MEADFRTFFLLMKTIAEIRRNPIFRNITAKSLFLLGKLILWLVATISFSISQRLLTVMGFFPSIEKVFFYRNPSFRLVETDFLATRIF